MIISILICLELKPRKNPLPIVSSCPGFDRGNGFCNWTGPSLVRYTDPEWVEPEDPERDIHLPDNNCIKMSRKPDNASGDPGFCLRGSPVWKSKSDYGLGHYVFAPNKTLERVYILLKSLDLKILVQGVSQTRRRLLAIEPDSFLRLTFDGRHTGGSWYINQNMDNPNSQLIWSPMKVTLLSLQY